MMSSPRTPTNSVNNVGKANSFTVVETAQKNALVLNDAVEIDAEQLAQYLSAKNSSVAGAKNVFVVDCRSFIQYNNSHVLSAVNAFYSKIMRRRLINNTVCSDSILNHLSLAGRTDNVDLVLYGSDNEESGSPTGQKDIAPLRLACWKKENGGGARTLYERRKQLEAAAAAGNKENDLTETSSSSRPAANELVGLSAPKSPNLRLKLNGPSPKLPSDGDSLTRPARPTLSLKMPNARNAGETTKTTAGAEGSELTFVRILFEKLRNSTRLKFHRILLLKDSFNDFRVQYPNLCESSRQQQKRLQKELDAVEKLDIEDEDGNQPVYPSTSVPPIADGPTKVLDFLYLGTMDDAEDEKFLRDNGITCAINICERAFRPPCVKDDPSHFKQISVKDSTDTKLRPLFDEVVEFIENARLNGDKVLIHCQAGISRSATLAIAYIIGSRRVAFRDAYDFVKHRRAAIEPNFAFIYQLMRYSDELRDEKTGGDESKPYFITA